MRNNNEKHQIANNNLENTMPKKRNKLIPRKPVLYSIPLSNPQTTEEPAVEKDIRDLVLKTLEGRKETQFFKISDNVEIERVLVLMIPKFDMIYKRMIKVDTTNEEQRYKTLEDIVKRAHKIMKQNLDLTLLCRNPGSKHKLYSTIQRFFQAEVAQSKINDMVAKEKVKTELLGKDNPMLYTLNEVQLVENDYLTVNNYNQNKDQYNGYILTTSNLDNDKGPINEGGLKKVIALDCEMVINVVIQCTTKEGPELTRVCLINENNEIILDHLIKPPNPITDYLFKYSGITQQMLENVTMTLEDAQKEIIKYVDNNVVLVGHSLENDLRSLKVSSKKTKIVHPYIIDTSVLFGHPKGEGFKPSLKWLAKRYLERTIQLTNDPTNNTEIGHDPAEDAKASLDLYKLKMKMGMEFGLSKSHMPFSVALKEIKDQTPERQLASCVIDKKGFASANCLDSTFIEYQSDEHSFGQIHTQLNSHQFVWCRLHDLEHELRTTNIVTIDKTNENLSELNVVRMLDQLETTLANLKANTLTVILNGHGTSIELSNLMKRRQTVMNEKVDYKEFLKLLAKNQIPIWNQDDEKRFTELIDMVKSGMCYVGVKA